MFKAFAQTVVCLLVLPVYLHAASPVIISEFMADNIQTLADEDGEYSDWIELQNVSTNLVNLENWCLTDEAANLTKWHFPATNLAAGAY